MVALNVKHSMRLHQDPFEKIKSGTKKVEIRLLDQKRKRIKLGDIIIFSKRPDIIETIEIKVVSLKKYSNYNELSKKYQNSLSKYYSKKEMEKGFLVIGVKLI
jgi:ASC-1-like (ASCH) protein